MQAIGDRVIVIRDNGEGKTKGGIVLPNSQKGPVPYGTVVSVGKDIEDEIKKGDIVYFEKHAGEEIKAPNAFEDTQYLCVKYEYIMAIV